MAMICFAPTSYLHSMRFRIRDVMFSLVYFLPMLAVSQYPSGRLDELYRYVEVTDSLATRSQRTFYLEKYLKDDFNYKETWRYTTNGGKIVFFQVDYLLDSTEYTEVYYLNRGRLVCSEEYETENLPFMDDRLRFGSILYFESATPRHIVMLGRKKQSWRMTEPGDLALTRFAKRYTELRRHIPMLPD
jgi:hypothetical protein